MMGEKTLPEVESLLAANRDAIATFAQLPPDALLTTDKVGEWLKVARRQVQRLELSDAAEGAS